MHDSEYHNLAALEQIHWWHVSMAAIAVDWLRGLPCEPGQRILDVGCGTGGALQWLTEFGHVCGLDCHPLALRLAGRHGKREFVQADVGALPFREGSVSILTAFDVLYHRAVVDDGAALEEFRRVLRPGGWLLLRVPAHDWLRGVHDDAVHTRHRYTRREVRDKLIRAGFLPVRVSYVNALLLVPAIGWRSCQRRAGGCSQSDVRRSSLWMNGLLKAVLRLERAGLRRFDLPLGLSVLALARSEGR